jgi:hypothetical protein
MLGLRNGIESFEDSTMIHQWNSWTDLDFYVQLQYTRYFSNLYVEQSSPYTYKKDGFNPPPSALKSPIVNVQREIVT